MIGARAGLPGIFDAIRRPWQTWRPMTTATLLDNPFATWFGIDEALVRKVLAAAMERGADFADVYFEHSRSTSIGMEDGIVSRGSTGVAV